MASPLGCTADNRSASLGSGRVRPRRDQTGPLPFDGSAMNRRRQQRTGGQMATSRSRSNHYCGKNELTPAQAEFLLVYEANGFNATAAYMATHPGCRSRVAAATEGHKTLRKPQVAAALAELRKGRMRRLGMDADEATLLTAMRARANLALAFDEDGNELPFHQWPPELLVAVKSRKPDGTVVLLDQQRATETILQMHGRLKNVVAVNHFDHVAYLAGKQRAKEGHRHEGQGASVRPDRR